MNNFKWFLSIAILIIGNCMVYGQSRKGIPISVVSTNKDTLFLTDDKVGYMIQEVWLESYEDKKPTIIIKPEDWIIAESIKRQESLTSIKPNQQ